MVSKMITIPEAAAHLNLAVSKVYELVHAKDFPAVKIGKNWRIFGDRLDAWLEVQFQEKEDYA